MRGWTAVLAAFLCLACLSQRAQADLPGVEHVVALGPGTLRDLDDVLLTPHVSWYTADTMARYLAAAVENCRRLHDGKSPYFVVNETGVTVF